MNFLQQIWQLKDLRSKIIFTIAILFLYRVLAQISVPGVDISQLHEFFGGDTGALGIYSLITGGSMENFSIVMMGLAPYINASIIVQLMTVVIPKLENLSKEGESGKKTIAKYTRFLTVFFAFIQSYGLLFLLSPYLSGVDVRNFADVLPLMLVITAGTMLLMWMGELITEKGLGNGISLLIFASIASAIPGVVGNIFAGVEDITQDGGKIFQFVVFLAITLILIIGTVLVTEGQRKIPVTYGSGGKTAIASAIPIRVLQAGMVPVIFALSLITLPSVILQVAQASASNPIVSFIQTSLNPSSSSPTFFALYFFLILFFSYFYVSIVFKPEQMSEDLQKRGGFIPGYRPGEETANHLSEISFRLNLWGGMFLAVVAIVPMVFVAIPGVQLSSSDLIISGSGIIIIVGVVLDLIRRINTQLVMHDYDKLK